MWTYTEGSRQNTTARVLPLKELELPTLKSAPSHPCFPRKRLPLAAGGRLHTQITLRSLVPHKAHLVWATITVFAAGLLSSPALLLLVGKGLPEQGNSQGVRVSLQRMRRAPSCHGASWPSPPSKESGKACRKRPLWGQVGTCPQNLSAVSGHLLTSLWLTALLGQEERFGAGSLQLEA